MKRFAFVFTAIIALAGCKNDERDVAAVRAEVNQIVTSIYAGAAKKDLTIYDHFSDSTTGVFSGIIMESWSNHKQNMEGFFKSMETIQTEVDIIDTDVLASNAATVLAKYKITATTKDSTSISSPFAFVTYVFQKTDGQWKIVHFHDSEPKP